MRTRSVVALLGALLLAVPACDDETPIAPGVETFVATLNGANVRPDPVTTAARGDASLALIGNVLSWKVDVTNIDNASAGHIHAEPSTGVVVPFSVTATGPNFSGTIAEGAATVHDSVIALIKEGRGYVNIHTEANPGGEIRGDLRRP